MGLSHTSILDLISLRRAGHLHEGGRVVEIGAQQLSNEFLRATTEIAELYNAFGCQLGNLGHPQDEGFIDGMERQPNAAPASRDFWQSLGFSYFAIEYGGYRDSISLDLNSGSVPPDLRSAFDLLINAGTTEHVANQDNAFRVMHDLVKPGGLMIHEVPASGMLTHGLVSYTMQFFWALCRENNYEVIDLELRQLYQGQTFPISRNIIDSNVRFGRFTNFKTPIGLDLSMPILFIHAILRKPEERPYVTMLDVPPEAR